MTAIALGTVDIVARQQAAAAGKRSLEAELDKYSYAALTGDADAALKVEQINADIFKLSQVLDNLGRAYVTAQRLEAEEVARQKREARVTAWTEARAKRDTALKSIKAYEKAVDALEAARKQANEHVKDLTGAIWDIDRKHDRSIITNEPGRFTDTPLQSNANQVLRRIEQIGNAALNDQGDHRHPDLLKAPKPSEIFAKSWTVLDKDIDEAPEVWIPEHRRDPKEWEQ